MPQQQQHQCFAFVFPMASGHINPSLAMARSLVGQGHEVHFLCREQMREAIEDTGAVFHSDIEHETELYEGREPDLFGAIETLKREHGLEHENVCEAMFKLKSLQLEMMLPGVIRWLSALNPSAVAYCPLMCEEAAYASFVLGIPSVALLTTAGAGSIPSSFKGFLAMFQFTEESVRTILGSYGPHMAAVDRMNDKYSIGLKYLSSMEPFGKLDILNYSVTTLVTTCELLQDPLPSELERAYLRDGVKFEAIGPLLDKQGAQRAAGHKFDGAGDTEKPEAKPDDRHTDPAEVLRQVCAARASGRSVILVSMGTIITGDSPDVGWEGLPTKDGQKRGLTGRELCRGAWGGAFDAFGEISPEDGPLLVVSLGPQADALGDLVPPANSVCAPMVPQVDILREGVAVFLTHGGQNSFTEALANSVPLVVCPGFGDQPVNACKAEAFGVGVQVPRPDPDPGAEAEAAMQYRSDAAEALLRVVAEDSFRGAATRCAQQLLEAGGVPRAVGVMFAAAAACPRVQALSMDQDQEKVEASQLSPRGGLNKESVGGA